MKSLKLCCSTILALSLFPVCAQNAQQNIPAPVPQIAQLPSWQDCQSRDALIAFINKVTDPNSSDFVAPAERIAVFDNDGTLWAEQPLYFQLTYAIDQVKEQAAAHPEWQQEEPFKSILNGDPQKALHSGKQAILKLMLATHSGMTTEEFNQRARKWLNTKKHPTTGKLYKEMVYQPMLEVLSLLRQNGFKTYIASGGGIDFIRVFAEEVYGIPPEQVIGSSLKTKLEWRDGEPVLVKIPKIDFVDDKEEKPVGIHSHIGRRPIAAFGNSDGDLQMLQWTAAGKGPRFCMYIHHTDPVREWAYDRESHIGKFDKGLDIARKNSWVLVDMKKDWKVIFPTSR